MMIDNNNMNALSLLFICTFFAAIGIAIGDEKIEHSRKKGNGSFKIGPDYKLDPDLKDQGNTKGKNFQFSMLLKESKI